MKKQSNSEIQTVQILLVLTISAVVYGVFALTTLEKYDFHPTAFLSEDVLNLKMYRPEFHNEIVVMESGYDAGFYYLVASNLSGRGVFKKPYFYKRILLPVLMYALAFGNQSGFPYAFLAISLASTIALALAFTVYLGRRGISPYWALGFALFPGIIINMLHAGADAMNLLFAILALLLTDEGAAEWSPRLLGGIFCLLLSVLAKESGLFFAGLLFIRAVMAGRRKTALLYLIPIALFIAWSMIVDKYILIGGDYGTKEAFNYNFYITPFAGIVEWVKSFKGGEMYTPVSIPEDVVAPALFIVFCTVVGVLSIFRLRKFDSVFFPLAVILLVMIPFCRYPILNLYSCLRVFLPSVICFIIMLKDWRPKFGRLLAALFIAAVIIANVFLFIKPPARHFLYTPGANQPAVEQLR